MAHLRRQAVSRRTVFLGAVGAAAGSLLLGSSARWSDRAVAAVLAGTGTVAGGFLVNGRHLSFGDKLGPVRAGMRLAATTGTASILTALPVSAGAKTGSAQDPSARNGAPDSWFTAAAPMGHPAMVATSFVRGGGHGVTTSGRVVLAALQYFFAHQRQVLRTGR